MPKNLLCNAIVFIACAYLLIGIDKEPYYEEGDLHWIPIVFIKHDIALNIIFEMPLSPTEVLRCSSLSPAKNNELANYCKIRYGNELIECKQKITKKMLLNGFYIPD
ncbi:hypothetical protein ABIE17_001765 [Lelliottia nimipressuralis]|uniref:hypothetical protein n=1 Tax=Lelliottia nimipressuralis TaxID=69220 RepID=UPI003D1D9261